MIENRLETESYTLEQFNEQYLIWRKMISSKEFWEQSDAILDRGTDGLTYCYLHTFTDDSSLVTTFKSAMIEYEMRRNMRSAIKVNRMF